MHTHVIFLHGLSGDVEKTWTSGEGSEAEYWPAWLEEDVPGVAVWGVGYPAARLRWGGGVAMAIEDRAAGILPRLVGLPELQSGTIALVGHSMGGLIIKEMLQLAEHQGKLDTQVGDFEKRVRKIAFLGTPHLGSQMATFAQRFGVLRATPATRSLVRNDPHLRALSSHFRDYATEHELDVLGLGESQRTFWGKVVEADSADLGLPSPAKFFLVDKDHFSITAPLDRGDDVYVHVRTLVAAPQRGQHDRALFGQMAEGIGSLGADVGRVHTKLDQISNALTAFDKAGLQASGSNAVVTAELVKRTWALRRGRYLIGFESVAEARRLRLDVLMGELSSADREARRIGLAWCARVLAAFDTTEAAKALENADALGRGEENATALAILELYRNGDRQAALQRLEGMDSRLVRSAKLIVAGHNLPPGEAVAWFDGTGWGFEDLDADGKFILEQKRLEAGLIEECLADAELVTEADYEHTPVLLATVAAVHLAMALPEEFRPAVFAHQRFEIDDIILRGDATSMSHRRRAERLYEQAETAIRDLGGNRTADVAADYALWLGLLDPARKVIARAQLEASMSEPEHALRRLPMALQFGIDLDLEHVERQIDAAVTISGGKSIEAGIARFAIARTKPPAELVAYIARHRAQLEQYYTSEFITAVNVQMLARSGQTEQARLELRQLASGGAPESATAGLRRMIEEAEGADPLLLREAQYRQSGLLPDLMSLIEVLKQREDWTRLIPFAEALLERAPTIPNASLLAEAFYRAGRFADALEVGDRFPEFMDVSQTLTRILAWSSYRKGDLAAAKRLALTSPDDINDQRHLLVNIAIASGDWKAIASIVEDEWTNRDKLSAEDLLHAGQLAHHIGSSRSRDLIEAAAQKGESDADILVGCYTLATSAGWEDSEDVHRWFARAVELSGEQGPVRRFDLEQLLDLQPGWNEREKTVWDGLQAGEFPLFGAAASLNRSLLSFCLTPALANLEESDPRKRGIIFAFSGARSRSTASEGTLALDPTALITLAFLGQLRAVIEHYEVSFVAHSTLRWLLAENQKVAIGQPSRMRSAQELRKLIDLGHLQPLHTDAKVDESLDREVGTELANLLGVAVSAQTTGTQHVVIRPYPVHRPTSLMRDVADLTDYETVLAGTWEVVAALKSLGQLTTIEEEEARRYLEAHEPHWPRPPELKAGAVLYLDGLAITYLQHLRLLDRLKPVGFTVIISDGDVTHANELMRYAEFAESTKSTIEVIRAALADGIASGKVRLGISKHDDSDPLSDLEAHPSSSILDLAAEADILVADDRVFNQHNWADLGAGITKPIATSIDLLFALRDKGLLAPTQLLNLFTKLRRAGYCLVPVDSDELLQLLAAAPVIDGGVAETLELKAIRESLLRVRMTDGVQLPKEQAWFDAMLRGLVAALRHQWINGSPTADAEARSNWILRLFDIRGWAHRTATMDAVERYKAQLLLLMMLPDATDEQRDRYWSWLSTEVLAKVKEESPTIFEQLLDALADRIDEAVGQSDDLLGATDEQ